MKTDPVCKMAVDEHTSMNKAFHEGKEYYFCSTECRSKFEAHPESYGTGGISGEARAEGDRMEGWRQKGEAYAEEGRRKAAQMAGDLKEKARESSRSIFESRKHAVAGRLEGAAKAFRQTSQNFQGEDPTVSGYAGQIADRIEGASRYLRDKDVDQLIEETERSVQRKPGLYLGAAFVAGIFAARFLKSSRQHANM